MPDSAAVNLYETSSGETLRFDVIDGTGYAEGLKITSQARNITVYANKIIGGYEDCVDVNNRCQNITVIAGSFVPRGTYLATIKGGSRNIKLKGLVKKSADVVEVDGGNHSEQSREVTSDISLDLNFEDGRPIRIRSLNAKGWHLYGGPYKCVFRLWGPFRAIFAYMYYLLKNLHLA